MAERLLVHLVDDSRSVLNDVVEAFEDFFGPQGDIPSGHPAISVRTFQSPADWLSHSRRQVEGDPDICILDLSMHGDDEAGYKLASDVRAAYPETVIVMFSGFDSADAVLRFRAAGADGFVSKKAELGALPKEVMGLYRLVQRRRKGAGSVPAPGSLYVGSTLGNVARRIPQILGSALRTVLVTGETGTGKEVIADLFEAGLRSLEASAPFVRLNCGAITPSLLESELFGHAKGAFTGATSARVGLLESASGGWIFLDEVACLPLPAQVALLRAIENEEIVRVGESFSRRIRIRVLSACNEDLEAKVERGLFRRDLWQRLSEATIELPALRERKDEIPDLVRHFTRAMGQEYVVTPAALEILQRYDWAQGNIRELRNCLRAMTEDADSHFLGPNQIPARIFDALLRKNSEQETFSFRVHASSLSYETLEEDLFLQVARFLHEKHGAVSLRSIEQITGVPRSTWSRRIHRAQQTGNLPKRDVRSRETGTGVQG